MLLGQWHLNFLGAKQDLASDSFTFSRCWCKGMVTSGPLSSWQTAYNNNNNNNSNKTVSYLNSTLYFHKLHSFTVSFDLQNQPVRMVRQEM